VSPSEDSSTCADNGTVITFSWEELKGKNKNCKCVHNNTVHDSYYIFLMLNKWLVKGEIVLCLTKHHAMRVYSELN
jgi:hypothetical protein